MLQPWPSHLRHSMSSQARENHGPSRTLRFLGLTGSLRRESYNRALLRAAAEVAPPNVEIRVHDLADLPMFNPDLLMTGEPAPALALKRAIVEADAVLFATPEYNLGVPAALKNAIDWASQPPESSPLRGKPAAIVGASTGPTGTVRAQQQLRQTLQYVCVHALTHPEFALGGARDKFDARGRLVDAPARARLERLLDALIDWTTRLQGAEVAPPGRACVPPDDRQLIRSGAPSPLG